MKPPPFRYVRPETLEEALAILAEHGDDAKVLAGGQSLVPLLNFRLARPAVLVDLELLTPLRTIEPQGDVIVVGAMVRQAEAERSPELASVPPIGQALAWVGHLQIRHRGTVGGSLAHADPAAELPAVVLALGAEMVTRSSVRERVVPAEQFFVGPFTTALEPDEILTHVRFPVIAGIRSAFVEFARRSGDFALAGVCAVNLGTGGDGRIALAAIGVGGTPVRLAGAEQVLERVPRTPEVIHAAGVAASAAVDPPSDVHADSAYRRELLGVLVRRALRDVA